MSTPVFSLCHATARLPWGWKRAHEEWRSRCDDWSKVEYILGMDADDCDTWDDVVDAASPYAKTVRNIGRKCAVDGWNAAGRAATGRFLITVADDLGCPEHWDTELLKVIPDLDGEYMIEVKSGTSPADDEWMRVQLHSLITKKYYDRIGNFFYPGYAGYYADCDVTEMARHHGVMVDARHLTFQHRHWIGTNVPHDEIYARQDSDANRTLGMSILGSRRASGFKGENRLP